MRILLAANASYVPPRGGATRSNLAWLSRLVAHGHECRVVAAAPPPGADGTSARADGAREDEVLRAGGVLVYPAATAPRRRERLLRQIRDFQPDVVVVSSEDVGQPLLAEAVRSAPGRVVCLAHTPQFLPMGEESWFPNEAGSALVREAAAVVVISRTMAEYVGRSLGTAPTLAHPPIYGEGPWPAFGGSDEGRLTIVNPCALKGLPIVLGLARALPELRFGALAGWGTTAADRRALDALPNLSWLPSCPTIDDVLRATRVLLVPSLWFEGFGLVVVEAMLRGIPVVASGFGGLVEAKLGMRFALPVRRIERYLPEHDERGLPMPVVPEQDLGPWIGAVRALSADRALYEEESARSREAATRFVAGLDPDLLERRLAEVARRSQGRAHSGASERQRRPAADAPLRILLAHNAPYFPAQGGGDRSNHLLLAALAARGHVCCAFARRPRFGPAEQRAYERELEERGVDATSRPDGIVSFPLDGALVRVLAGHGQPRRAFAEEIAAFAPDLILASTDDPAQVLLEAALGAPQARVVYLVRAPLALPFGPESAFASAEKHERLRQADAVVAVSEYVARYVREWGGVEAVHLPISPMEPGPYEALGRFENELVTLVNPCAVKGISILLALADRMPEVAFAAVPGWGTGEEDRRALAARPNVRMLPAFDRIDELLARTRVLLVPSLWKEARSRIVVEALLRGVPVLASDVGGIPEAMLGVPYLLPVREIQRFRPELDERMVPQAEVPPQDIAPWQAALRRLITDRAHYAAVSQAAREAALAYVDRSSVVPFELLLREVVRRPSRRPAPMAAARVPVAGADLSPDSRAALARLSPEKRELLALRLRRRAPSASRGDAASLWFPSLPAGGSGALRVFCLPHAGAGGSAFRGWNDELPSWIRACPVALPGRESRADEPAMRDMASLVDALGEAIAPLTEAPYALFGHSMGAGVAFELSRWLRQRRCHLPLALLVSGARAPQSRVGRVPGETPSSEELLEELRARRDAADLDDPELRRSLLPLLEADCALYRGYSYRAEEPLPLPIRAYGGAEDPGVSRAQLEAWREQTIGSFALRLLEGGHFFLRQARAALLRAVASDLVDVQSEAVRPRAGGGGP